MPLRRRRKGEPEAPADDELDEALETDAQSDFESDAHAQDGNEDGNEDGAGKRVEPTPAPRRPLDVTEADDGGSEVVPRLDLGSLRVPVFADLQVRVEMDDQRRPVSASMLHGQSAVQLLAFAAPRGDGLWDDVRGEIAESVRSDGGHVVEFDGPFGPELRARIKVATAPGKFGEQPVRFVGFDGPRWFLRAVFSGPAATDAKQAEALEAVLTRVVVVRGDEPMAPRDLLPLRLPAEAEAAQPDAQADQAKPSIDPFNRGPEISEIR